MIESCDLDFLPMASMYSIRKKTSNTAQIDLELARLPSAGHHIVPSVLFLLLSLWLSPSSFPPLSMVRWWHHHCTDLSCPILSSHPLRMGEDLAGWLASLLGKIEGGKDGKAGVEVIVEVFEFCYFCGKYIGTYWDWGSHVIWHKHHSQYMAMAISHTKALITQMYSIEPGKPHFFLSKTDSNV